MSEADDDELLLTAVAAADIDALERLYRRLTPAVFAVGVAITRDRTAAEDVLHDTFVRVYEKAHTYRPDTRPRAWVLAIARNLALDAVRAGGREASSREAEVATEDARLATLEWTAAMLTLEPVEREIVALHALAGLTHAEIAAQLALPPGTVRWKYRVALGRLAPLLAEASDG